MKKRIEIRHAHGEIFLIPAIGLMDMDWHDPFGLYPYRFRLAFAFLVWKMSIGLGKERA